MLMIERSFDERRMAGYIFFGRESSRLRCVYNYFNCINGSRSLDGN